jgi:hypothetical protein
MRTYSFKNTIFLVNGVEITGFSEDDDVINMERRSDSASDMMGADGHMMVSLSADFSGEIKIKLQQTSASNKYLNALHIAQEASGILFVPVQILFQDTYRNDVGSGSIGYIMKPSALTRGAKAQTIEWGFVVERLDMLLGNPLEIGSFLG